MVARVARTLLFLAVLAFGVAYFNDPFLVAWVPLLGCALLAFAVLRLVGRLGRLLDHLVTAAIRAALTR